MRKSTAAATGATGPPGADAPESQILSDVLLALGSRPDVRLWRQNTGVARYSSANGGGMVRFGVPGQADLSGIVLARTRASADGPVRSLGIRLEVEVKSARGKPTPKQLDWCAMIRLFGGIYILVRSADDATAQLDAELVRLAAGWLDATGATTPPPAPADRDAL